MAVEASGGCLGQLSRPVRRQVQRARQEIRAEGGRRGVHVRSQGRLRRRREACVEHQIVHASRQYRRHALADHPPGLDHAPPALRCAEGPGRRRPRRGASVDRHRGQGRHHRRPGAGAEVRLRRPALTVALALAAGAAAAQDLPPGFVRLRDIDRTIAQDMRYATANNFTGRPLPGYNAGDCILARPAAEALNRVQTDLAVKNLSLKVYDCYRPTRAVAAMARWAADRQAMPDTRRFYPSLNKERLFALGWIAAHSAHSRGVAVDLTIVPKGSQQPAFDPAARYGSCAGPATARAPDDSLAMGTSFDCFDAKSYR